MPAKEYVNLPPKVPLLYLGEQTEPESPRVGRPGPSKEQRKRKRKRGSNSTFEFQIVCKLSMEENGKTNKRFHYEQVLLRRRSPSFLVLVFLLPKEVVALPFCAILAGGAVN